MTTFDERDKGFENKFAHDEEVLFKTYARRNKLLGLWAAAQLSKTGADAEAYAKHMVESHVGQHLNEELAATLLKDLSASGMTAKQIQQEMDNLFIIAKKQITGYEN